MKHWWNFSGQIGQPNMTREPFWWPMKAPPLPNFEENDKLEEIFRWYPPELMEWEKE